MLKSKNLSGGQVKLLAIVGPTASGKTALAIKIAEKYGGEIICADSRTIYRGMDIGTAKPTKEEQNQVQHHLLDLVRPNEKFSVAQFQKLAVKKIKEIHNRGRLPIIVGGSGLYIDSVIFNYKFENQTSERDPVNPRHLKPSNRPKDDLLRPNTLVIGMTVDKDLLERRINSRVEAMVRNGFIEEVRQLSKKYGWDSSGLLAPGYKAFRSYLEEGRSLEDAKAQFVLNDLHLAKRQQTWFKRNKDIKWFDSADSAEEFIRTIL